MIFPEQVCTHGILVTSATSVYSPPLLPSHLTRIDKLLRTNDTHTMAMGGDGPWAIGVMWALTVVVFIFVLLRVYTRVVVVQSFGVDDHVFNLAFVGCLSSFQAHLSAFRSSLTRVPIARFFFYSTQVLRLHQRIMALGRTSPTS